jgi:hypothetical protein
MQLQNIGRICIHSRIEKGLFSQGYGFAPLTLTAVQGFDTN